MAKAKRKPRPTPVERAVRSRDIDYLKAAGHRGGLVAAEHREAKSAYAKFLADRKRTEDETMRQEANEHVVPIDQEEDNDRSADQ